MASEPVLEVKALDAFYDQSHVLQGVEFEMGSEPIAIIGRNGMGKTSLCRAIMGMTPPAAKGSIRFQGTELVGKLSNKIAAQGIGYVPQGRRLFPSLTVDEHLRMIGSSNGGRWTIDSIYELFPRLGERRRNGGMQLSGGEQQMLAIGRALLTNPKLLIMDEPSEGLAPTIVEGMIETLKGLVGEGTNLLLIEQNLGVATAIAERQLVMVAGKIFTETTATALQTDPDLQQRFLGVTRVEHA
jgi:branched-chain amino acid transport system ATP-binding protein